MSATDVNNYHRATVTPETNTRILVCNAGQTGARLCNRAAQGFEDHARDAAGDRFIREPALSSQERLTSLIQMKRNRKNVSLNRAKRASPAKAA
jgi:hypothetical protein